MTRLSIRMELVEIPVEFAEAIYLLSNFETEKGEYKLWTILFCQFGKSTP